MAYNFVKLSDVPVAEDGATHVLGTKDGQVVRIPASGLGAVGAGFGYWRSQHDPPKRAGCLHTGREWPGWRNVEVAYWGDLYSR